jgi:hypothetical protein
MICECHPCVPMLDCLSGRFTAGCPDLGCPLGFSQHPPPELRRDQIRQHEPLPERTPAQRQRGGQAEGGAGGGGEGDVAAERQYIDAGDNRQRRKVRAVPGWCPLQACTGPVLLVQEVR